MLCVRNISAPGSLVGAGSLCALISRHSEIEFDPALCQLFIRTSGNEAFWMQQDEEALDDYFSLWAHYGESMVVEYESLLELAFMFANIVDSKSEFTYRHSLGVKAVAALIYYLIKNFCILFKIG